MAVANKYVDANLAVAVDKKANSLALAACGLFVGVCTFETLAADDDGSIYRIFKGIDPNLIPVSLRMACDAITAGTDYDFGFYDSLEEGGLEIDKDCLADGINPSAGYSRILALDALVTVDLANATKRIYELAGQTLATKRVSYDLAITANTVGSSASTITVTGIFAQG